jgi:hypothetical protein
VRIEPRYLPYSSWAADFARAYLAYLTLRGRRPDWWYGA